MKKTEYNITSHDCQSRDRVTDPACPHLELIPSHRLFKNQKHVQLLFCASDKFVSLSRTWTGVLNSSKSTVTVGKMVSGAGTWA